MSSRCPEVSVAVVAAFRSGLGEGGLTESKNVLIEFRWARGDYDKLPAIATELLSRRVDVLVAAGGDPSARAARPGDTCSTGAGKSAAPIPTSAELETSWIATSVERSQDEGERYGICEPYGYAKET